MPMPHYIIKSITCCVFVMLCFCTDLCAQDLVPIQLDRPDQTECPFITPTHYIQVENGFNIENNNENSTSYSYPVSLWKYGVNEKFELRLITELQTQRYFGKNITGFSPIVCGFKASLFEEKGLIPKTSFIGHIATAKAASPEFATTYIAPSFRFTMQHTLSDKVALAYNLGAEWNGENAVHNYIYTLTTGIALTKKLGCYAELYGFLPAMGKADHRCDGGITYLINNNMIADISGGVGITDNAPKNYISLGYSFRFNTRGAKL